MRKIIIPISALLALSLFSCGGSDNSELLAQADYYNNLEREERIKDSTCNADPVCKEKKITDNRKNHADWIDSNIAEMKEQSKKPIAAMGAKNEIDKIEVWSGRLISFEADSDLVVKKMAKKFRKELVAYQLKRFPKIRLSIAEELKEKLWENDVNVKWEGKRNQSIFFIGGIYATNKNIKDSKDAVIDLLISARFKGLSFKWYDLQDDYTYYNLNSKEDSEI